MSTKIILVGLLFLECCLHAGAAEWETVYRADSSLLPTLASPSWRQAPSAPPIQATIAAGELRIQHSAGGSWGYYGRESMTIAQGIPVTLEARLRVASASSDGPPVLSIQTLGIFTVMRVFTDKITVYDMKTGWLSYLGDFTDFRTIRIACDTQQNGFAWVDGDLALSWTLPATGGQNGISFGASGSAGPFDSYWQYVAYSKEYLPVPEPSSLVALGAVLVPLAGLVRRRPHAQNCRTGQRPSS